MHNSFEFVSYNLATHCIIGSTLYQESIPLCVVLYKHPHNDNTIHMMLYKKH